jgi:hypothetical protein
MKIYRKRAQGRVWKNDYPHDGRPKVIYKASREELKAIPIKQVIPSPLPIIPILIKKKIDPNKTRKQLYYEYLRSAEWKTTRYIKLHRKGKEKERCAFCGATEQLHIHHLYYTKNFSDVPQTALRVACSLCHALIHKLQKEGKIKVKKNNRNHQSIFTITKTALLKHCRIRFVPKARWQDALPEQKEELDSDTQSRFNYLINK